MSEVHDGGPEVVLFDLGGVLMDFRGLPRLAELTGEADDAALRSRWTASRWVQAFERGACDADAFGEGVVRDWGLDVSPGDFMADFARWPAGPFSGSLELVRALHGSIGTGCLSNTNPVHWRKHLDRWGLVRYFDWTFVSYELGVMKPDPGIFRHAVRAIGTSADRILFLDDCADHVRAAREVGLRAERAGGVDEVRGVLESVLPSDSTAGRAIRSVTTGWASPPSA